MQNSNIDTELIRDNQLGAITAQIDRFGLYGIHEKFTELDREIRLEIMSHLTGRKITSIHDLTKGEAGKVLMLLKGCETIHDLYAAYWPPMKIRKRVWS